MCAWMNNTRQKTKANNNRKEGGRIRIRKQRAGRTREGGGGDKEDLNKEDLTPEAGWTLEVRK